MWHLFVVLKVSSIIKKGLSSTCRVILIWKLALASRKSSGKNWRFVLELIYQSLYSSILRESYNDHNSRTSSTHNTNDLLEPQGLQSYNTNSSWQWGQKKSNKMRCKFTLIWQILKNFFAKYFLAWRSPLLFRPIIMERGNLCLFPLRQDIERNRSVVMNETVLWKSWILKKCLQLSVPCGN